MFKNIIMYRFNKPFSVSSEELEVALSEFAFTPCGSQDAVKFGFTNALGKIGKTLVHSAEGYQMVAVTKESKLIPAGCVKEKLEARIAEIERVEGFAMPRSEKQKLKDDVINGMLPDAFTKKAVTRALIIPELQMVLVDSSSHAKAEEMLALLRKALGSLPVIPVSYVTPVEQTMTQWIEDCIDPSPFVIGNSAELKDFEGAVVKFSQHDLSNSEVLAHIQDGKQVQKLGFICYELASFDLCADSSIKRLKFDMCFSAQNDDCESAEDRADADFVLFSAGIAQMIRELERCLGGFEAIN